MKTVFITGAARGIGRATALLFAERGWNVAFGYVQSTKEAIQLENELKDKGVSAKGIRFDVAYTKNVMRRLPKRRTALAKSIRW